MDPNATYSELSKFFSTNEGPGGIDYEEARELWHALNFWLNRGGFLPGTWQAGQDRAKDATRAAMDQMKVGH